MVNIFCDWLKISFFHFKDYEGHKNRNTGIVNN